MLSKEWIKAAGVYVTAADKVRNALNTMSDADFGKLVDEREHAFDNLRTIGERDRGSE